MLYRRGVDLRRNVKWLRERERERAARKQGSVCTSGGREATL
jgi:hypothetical protein